MSGSESGFAVSSLEDMYRRLTLADVACTEFSARRQDQEEEGDDTVSLSGRSERIDEGDVFVVTMSVMAEGFGAEYKVTIRATYDVAPSTTWTHEYETEFVRKSSFVTIAPYLREALNALGARIQKPSPWLPLQGPHAPETLEVDVLMEDDDLVQLDS